MLTKIFLVLALVIVGLAYMMYRTMHPDLEEKWKATILGGMFGVSFIGGPIGEKLGFGSSMNITRSMLDTIFTFMSAPIDPLRVAREDTIFNGVPVRIYRPKSTENSESSVPAMVYFHGGGWIFGSITSHDSATAYYAMEANIIVVSVEYRLAPEHPYPVPLDDCRTAVEYFIKNAAQFNVDPKRVALGGDSAGGNLAAAVSLMLRDAKFRPMPKAQVLIYPLLQLLDFNTPSYFAVMKYSGENDGLVMMLSMYLDIPEEYKNGVKKNRHMTPALRKKYGGFVKPNMVPKHFALSDYKPTGENNWDGTVPQEAGEKLVHPYVSPGLAEDLRGLPEAFVFTAGTDALRDDGAMFSFRLKEAGVKTTWLNIKETSHGCTLIVSGLLATEKGRKANAAIVTFLKETL